MAPERLYTGIAKLQSMDLLKVLNKVGTWRAG